MARYHLDSRQAGTGANLTTATYKTSVAVWAVTATLCRGRAVGVAIGTDGAPNATDCQIVYAVQRQTADGTGTSQAGAPLIPGDVASRSTSKVNYSIEPTYSGIIWARVLNQRASMQWTAPDIDAALSWPATNLAGLALGAMSPTSSSYAGAAFGCVDYEDL